MGRWQGTEDTLALPLRASLVGELVRAGQASCGSMMANWDEDGVDRESRHRSVDCGGAGIAPLLGASAS